MWSGGNCIIGCPGADQGISRIGKCSKNAEHCDTDDGQKERRGVRQSDALVHMNSLVITPTIICKVCVCCLSNEAYPQVSVVLTKLFLQTHSLVTQVCANAGLPIGSKPVDHTALRWRGCFVKNGDSRESEESGKDGYAGGPVAACLRCESGETWKRRQKELGRNPSKVAKDNAASCIAAEVSPSWEGTPEGDTQRKGNAFSKHFGCGCPSGGVQNSAKIRSSVSMRDFYEAIDPCFSSSSFSDGVWNTVTDGNWLAHQEATALAHSCGYDRYTLHSKRECWP